MVLVYAHLQNWVIFGVNAGKYSIHGAYGIGKMGKHHENTWGKTYEKMS